MAEAPAGLQVARLYDYQRACLAWLLQREGASPSSASSASSASSSSAASSATASSSSASSSSSSGERRAWSHVCGGLLADEQGNFLDTS